MVSSGSMGADRDPVWKVRDDSVPDMEWTTMTEPTPTPAIWKKPARAEDLNRIHRNTIGEQLGIDFTEVGPDYLVARMPVDTRTKQPAGILHGGASVVLAETLGSVAAYLCLDEGLISVGLEVNANHLRAMREGWVTGRCRPVHIGRSTHVWQIDITDEDGRATCTSRLTIAVVPAKKVVDL
jgi:uncharacterized protein (TIGR00369 family)